MKRLLRQTKLDPLHYDQTLSSLRKQAKDNKPDDVLKRLATWLEADPIDLHFDWWSMHNRCAVLWSSLYENLERCANLLSFDVNEHRETKWPQVSLARHILKEAVGVYNAYQNFKLLDRGVLRHMVLG
jgi:hypothetical protein